MRFSRFELVSRLGAGGMGDVWRAHDQELHRDVAVKFLPERFAADPVRLGRFAQEARAASSLNHPNIVTIHEVGQISGLPYIVMEVVDGQTLRALLLAQEGRPCPTRRLLEIATQAADGLAKAHAAGIVHRDLKPENLMLTSDGFLKILDFGLAKLRSDDGRPPAAGDVWFDSGAATWAESPSPHTAIGTVLGTAGYMSPEQAAGRAVDFRSDQFTLGAILYELASCRQAFRRETPAQTIAAIIEDPPESLASLNPALPPPVLWIIERCLAKDPAERYAATLDLARELRNVRERLPAGSTTAPLAAGARPASVWRRPARLAATAVGILALAWAATRIGKPPLQSNRPPVVAMLPVTNLTGQPEYDATAVGIDEVVVTGLAGIDRIQVLSRLATADYRDRNADPQAIARQLDAQYLVHGVLQRSDRNLRVSLTLIQFPMNVVRWSGTFDGAFAQLFELQSRVADGLAGALRLSLTPPERERIEARPTASPAAWEEYAAGLALLDRRDRPGNVAAAVGRFEAALKADSRFARAHAGLARACAARYAETGDASWADRARDSAQEALRLQPGDADVRRALARILYDRGRLTEAIEELKQAQALKPVDDDTPRLLSEVLVDAGQMDAALAAGAPRGGAAPRVRPEPVGPGLGAVLGRPFRRRCDHLPPSDAAAAGQRLGAADARDLAPDGGRPARGRRAYREAIRLAPESRAWANLGYVYFATNRLDESTRAYVEAARLEPASGTIRRSLGDVRAKAGDRSGARADWNAAIALSRDALQVNPKDTRQLKNVAICLAKLGQRDEALTALQRAIDASAFERGHTVRRGRGPCPSPGTAPRPLLALEKALALGASASLAKDDEDLASLRALPRFRELLEAASAAPPGGEPCVFECVPRESRRCGGPVLTSVSCCWLCKPLVHGDIVSDVSKGRGLVKVHVTLGDDAAKKCTVQNVEPYKVVVFRGSAIRWKVVNNCSGPPERT